MYLSGEKKLREMHAKKKIENVESSFLLYIIDFVYTKISLHPHVSNSKVHESDPSNFMNYFIK